MATYKFLVDVAWSVTNTLIREWQREPFRWDSEIDFQCELVGRLATISNLLGCSVISGPNGSQLARIVAEPTTYYQYCAEPPKDSWCKPDVAIRAEQPDGIGDVNKWPMLWACEIKHSPYPRCDTDVDAVKLRWLLSQNLVEQACWIKLDRQPVPGGKNDCARDKTNSRLWIYQAQPIG